MTKGGSVCVLNSKQMEAKQYLQQIYRCNELIQANLEEIENLRSKSTSIGSFALDEERVSHSPSREAPFVKTVNKLVDLEKEVSIEMEHFLDLRKEIRDTINQLKNINRVLVLRYRYIEFMTWESIAEQMNYTVEHLHRIYSAALTDVADILATKGRAA